ncbi:MAG: hypothetical protein ABIZ49_03605 [Opitutaceae bacterium]
MKSVVLLLVSIALSAVMVAAPQPLLEQAVENWLGERDHWAFTQRAVEYDDGVPHERLERYDPSLAGNQRWRLISIDGKPPTAEQLATWGKRKFKKQRRRFDAPIGDFFDFAHAKVISDSVGLVRYQVPLRSDKNWLFPVDRVDVMVTVNKESRALEHLGARVREPFKVLLGIARVMGGDLELDFIPPDETGDPETTRPSGSARVTVTKMGERVDFTWNDFKRVVPYREPGSNPEPAARKP